MLGGLLIDLDDTLIAQGPVLRGAWAQVACVLAEHSDVAAATIEEQLHRFCAMGSDRGGIVDRAVLELGLRSELIELGVDTFRNYRPTTLEPYPGAVESLRALRHFGVRIAIVTDGNVEQQRSKVAAAALEHEVDAIVYSDSLGRAYRKPHRAPFELALGLIDTPAHHAVMIGDRPGKDIAGAAALGMRTIRVRQGEYAKAPDEPRATYCVDTVEQALNILVELSKPYAVA
jgi:putative hydrolase of the HAD superfamily